MFFLTKSLFGAIEWQRACVSVSDINQIELPNSSAGGIVRRHAYGVSARNMLFFGKFGQSGRRVERQGRGSEKARNGLAYVTVMFR